ncbi:MAG: beta-sandwich domain-containing protein [Candidatus Tyrphobacter sp.]
MSRLTTILAALLFATLAAGPVSAAAAGQGAEVVAQATGSVQGTATSSQGAPIAGATVTLVGPQTYRTTTDANGAFSIANVAPGIYRLTVEHPGFQTASNDVAIVAGAPQDVTVTMPAATFTSLQTIAHVAVRGRGVFNTTPASVNTLSAADFQDQGQYSVNHTLDQIPGIQISYPTSSADAASAGSIVVPNIRGGLSYETATLIDGHPLAVVDYGDYVTTFVNSFLFSYTEVIKGPGAMSPETNYAIGGTLNFHTKDPTLTFTPDYTFGYINDGGVYWNFGVSDTILNGRLGFVVDLAGTTDPGRIHGQQVYFNPHSPNDVIGWNGTTGNVAAFNDSNAYLGTSESAPFVVQGMAACCWTYNGYFNQYGDLFKLQYHLSETTRLTVSYLVTESYSDQDANTASTLLPAVFAPASGHGYAGSMVPGSQFWETSGGPYPGPGGAAPEINSEPIVQAEIASAIGNNTILARYYHANVNRTIDEGTDAPFDPILGSYTYSGVNHEASNYTTYNGVTETTASYDYFRQFELDKLNGWSFEFTHPYAQGDELTLSAESTDYETDGVGSISGCSPGANAAGQFDGFNGLASSTGGCPISYTTPTTFTTVPYYPEIGSVSTTVPGGSSQIMNTYMLRDITDISPTMTFTAALYENTYHNTYANECLFTPGWYGTANGFPHYAGNLGRPGAACAPNGFNVLPYYNTTLAKWEPGWITDTQRHFDDRFALEWRPKSDLAVRLSAGSGIAPEYLAELTKPTGFIGCTTACQSLTVTYNNPNLVPETSFGYDVGFDYGFADGDTFWSTDLYMTNLYDHFITSLNFSGTVIPSGGFCIVATGCPVYYSENENLSNSRFEGVEMVLKHIPQYGLGWHVAGSLEHAYAYDIPSNFYCTFTPTAAKPCIPANYNTNLAILAGNNFTGNGISTGYYCGPASGKTPAYQNTTFPSACADGVGGFSNTNIPYLTGNAEINWTGHSGMRILFGDTFLGKNNSFNAPPFWMAYTSVRVPINDRLSIQVSGDNVFNALPGYFEYEGTGPYYPLANGQQAATIENQLGPSIWHIELTKTFTGP